MKQQPMHQPWLHYVGRYDGVYVFVHEPNASRCVFHSVHSQRGRGAARVLANETGPRRRFEERRPGHLRIGAVVVTSLRLLRHSAGRLVFRQLPSEYPSRSPSLCGGVLSPLALSLLLLPTAATTQSLISDVFLPASVFSRVWPARTTRDAPMSFYKLFKADQFGLIQQIVDTRCLPRKYSRTIELSNISGHRDA